MLLPFKSFFILNILNKDEYVIVIEKLPKNLLLTEQVVPAEMALKLETWSLGYSVTRIAGTNDERDEATDWCQVQGLSQSP